MPKLSKMFATIVLRLVKIPKTECVTTHQLKYGKWQNNISLARSNRFKWNRFYRFWSCFSLKKIVYNGVWCWYGLLKFSCALFCSRKINAKIFSKIIKIRFHLRNEKIKNETKMLFILLSRSKSGELTISFVHYF